MFSTKSSDRRDEIHIYQEPFDDDYLYLKFQGKSFEFKASGNGISIRIPLAWWAVIREAAETKLIFELADRTDDELIKIVEREVDERIKAFKEAKEKGSINHFTLLSLTSPIGCSPIYGMAGNPRREQIEMGLNYYREQRSREQSIGDEIKELIVKESISA